MGLSIIQLSDIHIKNEDDLIFNRISRLKSACASKIRPDDDVILIISGDIAFSGETEQYSLAKKMIDLISSYIIEQKKCKIHYAFVPGNHDCNFQVSNSVRDKLLTDVNNEFDIELYNNIRAVQDNYYDFINNYNISSDELITQKEIDIEGNKILLNLINTAWMSILNETPGRIVIPKYAYPQVENSHYKSVITIQHHPINWFNPDYLKAHSDFIRCTTDLFFVGHEHTQDTYELKSENWTYKELHAKELQDSNSNDSEFSILLFDNTFENIITYQYRWDEEKSAYDVIQHKEEAYHKNTYSQNDLFYPNIKTIEYFNDPGITISHFSKEDVTLKDIFVWPDVNKSNIKNESSIDILIKNNLFSELNNNKISIISGNNNTGKTSLGKILFLSYADIPKCCLFIDGKILSSSDPFKIDKILEEQYENQYSKENLEMFSQLPKEDKILIIDNFNDIKLVGEKKNNTLDYLLKCFEKVFLLVSSGMEIPQLLSLSSLQELDEIPYYEIRPFGNSKRKELITKWYYLNGIINSEEINKKIENVNTQINKLLGNSNSFMPAVPIFLLTFLQNIDSINPMTFQSSKYSFLYESLIKKSLSGISDNYLTSGLYSIDVKILSTLAFDMLQKKSLTFSINNLTEAVNLVNDEQWLNINFEDLKKRMLESKIFYQEIENSDIFRFRYPYIYYYFAGFYISENLNCKSVVDQIEYMSRRLYNEDYGNIIIFICHFSNNNDIISTILINAYSILENYPQFKFENSIPMFNEMQEAIEAFIPKDIRDNSNVEKNKKAELERLDSVGITDGSLSANHDTIDDDLNGKEQDLASLNAAFKTLDVLGQILQNYPGNVEKRLKIEMIQEIHDLGMRTTQAIISIMGLMEEDLINFIQDEVKDKDKKSHDELVYEIKKFITMMLSSMIRAIVKKIAISLNSEYLLIATTDTFQEKNTISTKLILQELKMNCLNSFSLSELKSLNTELSKTNDFARYILRSTVANYLKFNDCEYRLREKLCDEFELDKKCTFISSEKEKALNK